MREDARGERSSSAISTTQSHESMEQSDCRIRHNTRERGEQASLCCRKTGQCKTVFCDSQPVRLNRGSHHESFSGYKGRYQQSV